MVPKRGRMASHCSFEFRTQNLRERNPFLRLGVKRYLADTVYYFVPWFPACG
jgi:hypothetical protein